MCQEHQKIVAAEHDMGSAQSYRAGLSISVKFESPDVFNHCIVRLNKNDVIARLKFAKFQPGKAVLEKSQLLFATTGAHNKILTC